jgi:serine/threonine/tyrosine protein kinase RAD53
LIPTNPDHSILKIPWARPYLQIGRGPQLLARNDVVLKEKRLSNTHCRITLGLQSENGSGTSMSAIQSWKDGESEPEVWIEDLSSSNGTFVGRSTGSAHNRSTASESDPGAYCNTEMRFPWDIPLPWTIMTCATSFDQSAVGAPRSPSLQAGTLPSKSARCMRNTSCWTCRSTSGEADIRLGKGSFAEVRRAVELETGSMRAIKVRQYVKRLM